MKVLLIDDDSARGASISGVLAAAGYDVELADRERAFADASALVIASGASACDVCKLLKLDEGSRRVIVLLSSGAIDAVLAALDAGADSYVTPPLSDKRIVACVRGVLEPPAESGPMIEVMSALPRERLVAMLATAIADGATKLEDAIDRHHHQQFMSVVAHELRNPLQSLLLRAQLAASGDPRATAALAPMVDAKVSAVVAFMAEVMEAADLDTGSAELIRQPIRIAEVAKHAIERLPSHDLVSLRVGDALPEWIEADAERFGTIVQCMLRNAFKFSPAGATIDVGLEMRGDVIRLSVTDEGLPIPAEESAQVFGPFYRRHGVVTGLGLYVSRRLAELHGGGAGVEASTFWVEIPIAPKR